MGTCLTLPPTPLYLLAVPLPLMEVFWGREGAGERTNPAESLQLVHRNMKCLSGSEKLEKTSILFLA